MTKSQINEGESRKKEREPQPGKRQCMSRATTCFSSQSQFLYAVDSSIHALPVPCLCLSLAVPSLSFSYPIYLISYLSPSQLLKNHLPPNNIDCLSLTFTINLISSGGFCLQYAVILIYI